MEIPVRILHLEDSAADAELVRATLVEAGMTCQITRVQTAVEFRQALTEGGCDLILADYTLPTYDGRSALQLAREICPEVPFLFVSGTLGEDAAIEALTTGATDYVLKHRLSRLVPAVERALCEVAVLRERKQAEEALAESEEKYRDLVERARDIIYTLDAQGRITFASPAVKEILGYAPDELLGRSFLELAPQEMHDEAVAQFDESLRIDRFASELTLIDKQGRPHIVEYSTSPIEKSGRVLGIRGIARDITERKRAEAEREKLIADLEQQNAELERFFYTVSHDLKTPLITLEAFMGMLQQDMADNDSQAVHDDVTRMSSATTKMAELLEDLLELSRVGRVINPSENVSIEELAHEAIDLLNAEVHRRDVQVSISPDLPVIIGDRTRLREVLQNLIENALKYMGDQPEPRIEIRAREEADEQTTLVRDNGIGINPCYHDKIFGLFNQLDQQTEGSGVGLAIAKRIVELHGGHIWVESEGPGHGSTFCFAIPSQKRASVSGASSDPFL